MAIVPVAPVIGDLNAGGPGGSRAGAGCRRVPARRSGGRRWRSLRGRGRRPWSGMQAVDERVVQIGLHVLGLEKARGQDGEERRFHLLQISAEFSLLLELGQIGQGADRFEPGHEKIFRAGKEGVDVEEIGPAEGIVNRFVPQPAQRAAGPGSHGAEPHALDVAPAAVESNPGTRAIPAIFPGGTAPVGRRAQAGQAADGVVDLGRTPRRSRAWRARGRRSHPPEEEEKRRLAQISPETKKPLAQSIITPSFRAGFRRGVARSGRCGWPRGKSGCR